MGSPAEGRRRTRGLCSRVLGVDDAPFRPVMGKRGDAGCRQAPRPELCPLQRCRHGGRVSLRDAEPLRQGCQGANRGIAKGA